MARRGAAAEAFAAAGGQLRLPSSGWRWRTTCGRERTTPRRSSWPKRRQARPSSAGARELRARALGIEGVPRAKRGGLRGRAPHGARRPRPRPRARHDLGGRRAVSTARASSSTTGRTTARAQGALDGALDLCEAATTAGTITACVTCMVYVLRECGDWQQALKLGRELIASETAVWVAEGLIGGIHAYQGKLGSARRLLTSALATASGAGPLQRHGGHHRRAGVGGRRRGARREEAARHCRSVLARWESSEDHHYSVKGLRWGAGLRSARGDLGGAHACSEALASIAARQRARAEAAGCTGAMR